MKLNWNFQGGGRYGYFLEQHTVEHNLVFCWTMLNAEANWILYLFILNDVESCILWQPKVSSMPLSLNRVAKGVQHVKFNHVEWCSIEFWTPLSGPIFVMLFLDWCSDDHSKNVHSWKKASSARVPRISKIPIFQQHLQWQIPDFWGGWGVADLTEWYWNNWRQNCLSDSFVPFLASNFKLK